MLAQYADQTGMKALHMFTPGDAARNATFAFFADANYFITGRNLALRPSVVSLTEC